MPRSFLAFVALCAFALLGADAPLLIGTPSVVVYPMFANDSSIEVDATTRISGAIASRISEAGGIKVIPPRPGVARANYLADARQAGADYYVTGLVAGLGSGVSMVLQLVSTQNGIVIFSASSQVATYADAAGQGDILRQAILRHASRSVTQIEAMPSAVLPTPTPGSRAEADLGKILGRKGRGPAPSPTPAAVAAAAVKALALLPLAGNAPADRRDATLQAIAAELGRGGVKATIVADQAPAAACSAAGSGGVLGGTLDMRQESGLFGRSSTATLRLIQRDCAGNTVQEKTVARSERGGEGEALAAEHAADAAVGALLHPAPQKR